MLSPDKLIGLSFGHFTVHLECNNINQAFKMETQNEPIYLGNLRVVITRELTHFLPHLSVISHSLSLFGL